jgi:hypothetical protein
LSALISQIAVILNSDQVPARIEEVLNSGMGGYEMRSRKCYPVETGDVYMYSSLNSLSERFCFAVHPLGCRDTENWAAETKGVVSPSCGADVVIQMRREPDIASAAVTSSAIL